MQVSVVSQGSSLHSSQPENKGSRPIYSSRSQPCSFQSVILSVNDCLPSWPWAPHPEPGAEGNSLLQAVQSGLSFPPAGKSSFTRKGHLSEGKRLPGCRSLLQGRHRECFQKVKVRVRPAAKGSLPGDDGCQMPLDYKLHRVTPPCQGEGLRQGQIWKLKGSTHLAHGEKAFWNGDFPVSPRYAQ